MLVAALVFAATLVGLLSSSLLTGRVLAAEDVLDFQSPFAPALAPHHQPSNLFMFDTFYQMHPDMLFVRDALRSGDLPTWNPFSGGGEPLLASQQHAMFSPFNWLASIAPFWQSLEWLAFLKLLAAGLGLYLLLVSLGLRRSPAILGGVAFMLSAPLINWLSHPHVNVYVVVPWLLLAAERLAREGTWREALWVALAVAFVMLGGHPPSMVITASVALPWFVYRLGTHAGPSRRAGSIALKFAAGGLLGALVSGIVSVPLLELSGQSYQVARGGGGGPKSMILNYFMPELWGRPDKFEIAGGPNTYIERTGYFGVIPMMFAVTGFARRPRGPQIFFAIAGLIALGLVVKLPFITSFFSGLPGIDQVNRLRYVMVVALAGAVLAAYGLDAMLAAESRRSALAVFALIVIAAVLPVAWVAKHRDVLSHFSEARSHIIGIGHTAFSRPALQLAAFLRWALFAVIAVGLTAVALWKRRTAVWIAAALVAITAFELVSFERGWQPAIPMSEANPPTPAAITQLQRTLGHGRVAGQVELGGNIGERYALRDARLYRSPPLERRGRVWTALGGEGTDFEVLLSPDKRLADFYGVGYELSYELMADKSGQWKPDGVPPIVRNVSAPPRAWVAYSWKPARNLDDALPKIVANTGKDQSAPVIEGAPPAPAGTPQKPGAAKFVRDGNTSVALSVDAARPGQLILADTWYPGWQAKVDGHDATIRPANGSFRAVAVPAGRHTVTFDYKPTSVRIGLLLTLLGVSGLILGFVLTRPRRTTAGTRPEAAPTTTAHPAPADR